VPEVEHLPACAFYGIGVVPYSPLARGVLTGKYDPDAAPPGDSRAARNDARMMQTEWRRESLLIARTLKTHAEARGITASQFSTAWVLGNKLVTSVIAGPRVEAQLNDYLGALNYRFHRRRRGSGELPGGARPCVDAGIYRSAGTGGRQGDAVMNSKEST